MSRRLDVELILVWREGSDNFFETRVATQGIPLRHQFQLTIAERTGVTDGAGKLLTGDRIVANPSGDHRKIGGDNATNNCVFFYWNKLDCCRPSRSASSFRPRAASIKLSTDRPRGAY
jgi:hypothetical protein